MQEEHVPEPSPIATPDENTSISEFPDSPVQEEPVPESDVPQENESLPEEQEEPLTESDD